MRNCFFLLAGMIVAAPVAWAGEFKPVVCESGYAGHLQGLCSDGKEAIYWSYTVKIVKTDTDGNVLIAIDAPAHSGDMCYKDGDVYVALHLNEPHDPSNGHGCWIYRYSGADLSIKAKYKLPEAGGCDGLDFHNGRFLVVGWVPPTAEANVVYEYDENFKFLNKRTIDGGYTEAGIQGVKFWDGRWWLGCYGLKGKPAEMLVADESLSQVDRYAFEAPLGLLPLGNGKFLAGRNKQIQGKGYVGWLVAVELDSAGRLKLSENGEPKNKP